MCVMVSVTGRRTVCVSLRYMLRPEMELGMLIVASADWTDGSVAQRTARTLGALHCETSAAGDEVCAQRCHWFG
jgi:hypothetical protein